MGNHAASVYIRKAPKRPRWKRSDARRARGTTDRQQAEAPARGSRKLQQRKIASTRKFPSALYCRTRRGAHFSSIFRSFFVCRHSSPLQAPGADRQERHRSPPGGATEKKGGDDEATFVLCSVYIRSASPRTFLFFGLQRRERVNSVGHASDLKKKKASEGKKKRKESESCKGLWLTTWELEPSCSLCCLAFKIRATT